MLVVLTRSLELEGTHYLMDTPDNAWKTVIMVQHEISKKCAVDDIKRFESALNAFIEADQMVMQRLIWGNDPKRGQQRDTRWP